MTSIDSPSLENNEKQSNLRAIFEILSYLHFDAERDKHPELAQRLEFAMKWTETKLADFKTAKTVPPVISNGQ